MPRLARVDIGNEIYHVINRASGRLQIFSKAADYELFEDIILEAKDLTGMRILAYTIMPNHWHFVLHPQNDGDLGVFMHRLTNAHTRRVHVKTKTIGYGPLYQGRYKSFLVDSDQYFITLLKYVERNPVRAKLTGNCEDWKWGSAHRRNVGESIEKMLLDASPVPFPDDYQTWVNTPDSEDDLDSIRTSVNKGVPYGRKTWVEMMVERYDLETTRRPAGRPRKKH
jgi:putative transposase